MPKMKYYELDKAQIKEGDGLRLWHKTQFGQAPLRQPSRKGAIKRNSCMIVFWPILGNS